MIVMDLSNQLEFEYILIFNILILISNILPQYKSLKYCNKKKNTNDEYYLCNCIKIPFFTMDLVLYELDYSLIFNINKSNINVVKCNLKYVVISYHWYPDLVICLQD